MSYGKYYSKVDFHTSTPRISQLAQLLRIVWDGDLISTKDRDELVKSGLAFRIGDGWNIISPKGIICLQGLGLINS